MRQTLLWVAAVAFFVVGDVATTAIGLELGAREANPNTKELVYEYGIPGMLAVKTMLVAFAYQLCRWTQRGTVAVPASLALFGFAIVLWNTKIILTLL